MTSQKLNEEHEILRRFMAVVVSSAFKNSLINRTIRIARPKTIRIAVKASLLFLSVTTGFKLLAIQFASDSNR